MLSIEGMTKRGTEGMYVGEANACESEANEQQEGGGLVGGWGTKVVVLVVVAAVVVGSHLVLY